MYDFHNFWIFLEFQKIGFLTYLMVPGVPGSLKIDSEKSPGGLIQSFIA